MGTLTIRNVDELTHDRLRRRAAENGRSVEAEVRDILAREVRRPKQNLLMSLHAAMQEIGGVDLELPARTEPPRDVDLS
ncbi:FitA-like ribbon-helix-helix domain-containing protein [Piscicoccus intestinalis]|uniref:FitA-like ribbon-helix-helix domain-containing protein n=1 Tax=Piscicoccus intestinalis TaxID=746033 RepID=UPI0008388004|nr:toxin-antitoxin system antitoxin subunit [Piscicoccus intestinalis]